MAGDLEPCHQMEHMEDSTGGVRIVSRRAVRPEPATSPSSDVVLVPPPSEPQIMELTLWDLKYISVHYIQKGVLLPSKTTASAQAAAAGSSCALADGLASSFARALGRFYPLAGRFVVVTETSGAGACLTVSLSCTGDGAEFVHAVAPEVSARDVVVVSPPVVRPFFPCNGMLCGDAMVEPRRRPVVVAAQVTELADTVFVALSLNHAAADGTTFWHLFNTWSEIHRRRGVNGGELSMPPPALGRWFPATCPVPVTLPFRNVEDMLRRRCGAAPPPVRDCFFHLSAASVRSLSARANAEMATATTGAGATNAEMAMAVACVDEARTRDELASWHRKPQILYPPEVSGADVVVLGSPRFDVYGNDFCWGAPVAVRSGAGNKMDGVVTVYQGRDGGGSMGVEVCMHPEALPRLTVDREFMEAVDMA